MRRVLVGLAVLTAAFVALEFLLVDAPEHPRGVAAVLGVLGCVAIVVVSKALGKAVLQRPESRGD